MDKTKQISKKDKKQKRKKIHDEEGNPILNHLSDFVVSIKSDYDSKAIYTGGRILTSNNKIYASCNDQIQVYSITENKIVDTIKHNNQAISNFVVCPHDKFIVTFTNNYLLRVIHLENKKLVHTVRIDKYFAFDMNFSKNGNYLAIGCVNSFVKIFTFSTMKQTHNYKHHSFCVRKVSWHPNPDNLQIISADEEANLAIFDYILNKVVSKAQKAGKNFVLTPKGTNIITSCGQSINVYEYQGLKFQYTVPLKQYIDAIYLLGTDQLLFGGEETELYKLDLNSVQHTITKVKNGTQNGVMKIMSVNNNKQIMVVSLQQNLHFLDRESLERKNILAGFNDEIIDLKYSKGEQSRFYLMVTNSNFVKLMDRETHQIVSLIEGHKEIVLSVEYYHPFAITSGKDKIIKLWKISNHGHSKLIANYRGHLEDITSIAMLFDEKIIVSVSQDKTIKVWAMCAESQQKVEVKSSLFTIMAHNKSINSVKVFPKQNLIATCSQDKTIKIWQWQHNVLKNLFTLVGHKRGVWDCIFHQIQKLLVSVAGDGMMKGWNLINGQCLWSMGEGQGLLRCAWLYHNQVITGSFDGIIKIWDIRKQTSTSYDKHGGKIWALDVIRDHNDKCEIMSGDNDSKFCVWKDNTEEVRNNIISGLEHNQQQKANYQYYMHEKRFIQAAKVAFQGNYTQLFINAINSMFCAFDEESQITENQEGEICCQTALEIISDEQLKGMIKQLMKIDLSRLLQILKSMNSTIKHFKIANKLLFILLQSKSWKEWQQFDKQFIMIDKNQKMIDEISQRKSDFQRYIENMMLLTEKHYKRLEKYKRNSYWFDYIEERRGIV